MPAGRGRYGVEAGVWEGYMWGEGRKGGYRENAKVGGV